jgi:hypothetical protein
VLGNRDRHALTLSVRPVAKRSRLASIKGDLRRQWNKSQHVARAGIEDQEGPASILVPGGEEFQPAMAFDRISFPIEAVLRAHDSILGAVLCVRSGTEKDVELTSVFGSHGARYRSRWFRGAASGSSKRHIRRTVAGNCREINADLHRRLIDVDAPVVEKLCHPSDGKSLKFICRLLLVALDARVAAAYRSGERQSESTTLIVGTIVRKVSSALGKFATKASHINLIARTLFRQANTFVVEGAPRTTSLSGCTRRYRRARNAAYDDPGTHHTRAICNALRRLQAGAIHRLSRHKLYR